MDPDISLTRGRMQGMRHDYKYPDGLSLMVILLSQPSCRYLTAACRLDATCSRWPLVYLAFDT